MDTLDEGHRLEQIGQGEAARQLYRQALETDQHCEEAWLSLADSLARENRWDETASTCIGALQALFDKRANGYAIAGETLGKLHYWLAQALDRQGCPELAILELRLAAHYMPIQARVQHTLGMMCWAEGRLEEARTFMARALTLKYDEPDTLQAFNTLLARRQAKASPAAREAFEKGLALYQKQNYGQAIRQLQAAEMPEARSYLGLCRLALQDAGGLDDVEQAARDAPDNADVLKNLAWSYAAAGRLDEAAAVYLRAIQAQPTHVAAYAELGLLYQHQQRWAEAFEMFRRARYFDRDKKFDARTLLALCENWVKAEPENAQAHYQLALRYVTAENWANAISELTAALLRGYNQTEAYVYLALAFLESKDWTRAGQALKTVLAAQPAHALARLMSAYLYFVGIKDARQALSECEMSTHPLATRMIGKIKNPSRDDQTFWVTMRRQIKAEVVRAI